MMECKYHMNIATTMECYYQLNTAKGSLFLFSSIDERGAANGWSVKNNKIHQMIHFNLFLSQEFDDSLCTYL